MPCKSAIEKAYDHINRDFLLYMLRSGFGGEMVFLDSSLYMFSSLFCFGEWHSYQFFW